jgi:steroid delta-isomerase-like uncharacterized protein
MSTEENKALVRRIYGELNKQNLAIIDEGNAADFVCHVPGIDSREGLKQLFTSNFAAFPDQQNTIEDLIADGDKVVVRYTVRGTHQGEFLGIPPTGKQFTFTEIDIHRIVNGKIQETWSESSIHEALQQLGVAPAPGQATT